MATTTQSHNVWGHHVMPKSKVQSEIDAILRSRAHVGDDSEQGPEVHLDTHSTALTTTAFTRKAYEPAFKYIRGKRVALSNKEVKSRSRLRSALCPIEFAIGFVSFSVLFVLMAPVRLVQMIMSFLTALVPARPRTSTPTVTRVLTRRATTPRKKSSLAYMAEVDIARLVHFAFAAWLGATLSLLVLQGAGYIIL